MQQATFGQRLAAARKFAGFRTQTELADTIGVSARTIRNYEADRTRPDPGTLALLRKAVGEFDSAGDPVEVAIRGSELVEWRQDTVVGFYKRHLAEQREERGA